MEKYTIDENTYDDIEEWTAQLLSGEDESLYESRGWMKPTKTIKRQFDSWRKESFVIEKKFTKGVDPKSEFEKLDKSIHELFAELGKDSGKDSFKKDTTDAYYRLALLLGKIDYIKSLNIDWEEIDYSSLTIDAIALFCHFIGEVVTPNNIKKFEGMFKRELSGYFYQRFHHYNEHLSNRVIVGKKHHHKVDNILTYFLSILPFLKDKYPVGCAAALVELKILKDTYPKEFAKNILHSNY